VSYEIRWMRDDDRDQVLDLLDLVMQASRGYFSDSFRKSGASAPSLLLIVDGEIASHIRIFDRPRSVGACLIRSAEIGDVCTHPRLRGRGYMTALLNTAAQLLTLQGYDISSVYSGVPIYQKSGWVNFPEPDQYLLWRLLNLRLLLARTTPVFEQRAKTLATPYEGVLEVRCNGQRGFLEFTKDWARPLEDHRSPDLTLDLDQQTFFRLLVGRDTPEELGLPETLGLADHEAQLLAALFPKARPRF
jgi:GNAT superfamily N-acetyltransferase